MRLADRVSENVAIAADVLRTGKLRSGLTILGVVIGVATVMAMAAIVQGIRDQIVHTIEIAGPTTFYVVKYFAQTPVNPDQLPKEIRIRPDLTPSDADRVARLPEVWYASIWAQTVARLEYAGARTQPVAVFGADDGYTVIQGGELARGRWFTKAELASGANVVVLQENSADRVFGRVDPLDKLVRVGGRPARVIGVYREPGNIFAPPGQETGAILPYLMLDHEFRIDRTNALWIPIKPRPGVSVTDAQAAVTVLLREMRHLRPADHDTFDLVTQDQILQSFNSFTGAFFWVMIALASVGLLVGGIGVMAIMMVSVTDRTREIGVRKALGASQVDILLQFLVEAALLTGIGGAIGVAVGLTGGRLVTTVMHVQGVPPLALTVVAVSVSIGIGLIFGLAPALRAARLNPIDALRYE